MKFSRILAPALALAAVALAAAEVPTRAQIVRERDAILVRIAAVLEERHHTGAVDDAALFAARLALAEFRRDTAAATGEMIVQQQVIVSLREQRLAAVRARAEAGLADEVERLRATDDLLAARQALAEWQAREGKG